jgi:hypothetical protein
VKWHDGKDLSADDVCFTINAMLNPKTAIVRSPRSTASRSSAVSPSRRRRARDHRVREAVPQPPRARSRSRPARARVRQEHRGQPGPGLQLAADRHRPDEGREGHARPSRSPRSRTPTTTPRSTTMQSSGGRRSVRPGAHAAHGRRPGRRRRSPRSYRPDVRASDDVALKSYDLRSWWFIALNTRRRRSWPQARAPGDRPTLDRNKLRELTIGVEARRRQPALRVRVGPVRAVSPYYNRAVPVQERSDLARAKP